MDYEKAYKAVLETATQWIKDGCTDKEKICLESVFPELRESEDERIRKWIYNMVENLGYPADEAAEKELEEMQPLALAYLEKQKINTEGDFGRGYDCGYQAGYAVAVNEMKPKVATATLESEKQKESLHIPETCKDNGDTFTDEDERIRKELIEKISNLACGCFISQEQKQNFIAYLDKQKELKPAEITPNQFDGITYGMKGYSLEKPAEWDEDDERNKDRAIFYVRDYQKNNGATDGSKECVAWLKSLQQRFNPQPKQEWSEEDRTVLNAILLHFNAPFRDMNEKEKLYFNWLQSLPERFSLQPKQEWSEDNIKELTEFEASMLHIGMSFFGGSAGLNPNNTNEVKKQAKLLLELVPKPEWSDEDERKYQCIRSILLTDVDKKVGSWKYSEILEWYEKRGVGRYTNSQPHWKPSEEKKKETLDGADIGYGLETAIDILENGFTHYQTDDGEYERKQALDVLIFLLNETRKKEDAKLWSEEDEYKLKQCIRIVSGWEGDYDIVKSPYSNFLKSLRPPKNWKEGWCEDCKVRYNRWKPSEEQMDSLRDTIVQTKGYSYSMYLPELYEQLKKL